MPPEKTGKAHPGHIKQMTKTAIILGATGLTGSILLELLLKDNTYTKVKVFGRSSCKLSHAKLEESLGDMFNVAQFSQEFKGDVVFCCIGTTRAKTPSKETYKKIDYGIPVQAARLAKENGIKSFMVISAMGANPKSPTYYNKIKGEMEKDVRNLELERTYIFRPSLIGGQRKEKRTGERIAQVLMRTFGFLIPKAYKIIEPDTIAFAMQKVAAFGYPETIIFSDKISEIAHP